MTKQATRLSTRLRVTKFKSLLAEKIAIQWLIQDVFAMGAVGLLAGDSGIGKTWLLLDLILAVAIGGRWLGRFQCRQGAVLVIDEENHRGLILARLKMLCKARGIKWTQDLPIYFAIGNAVDLTPLRDARTGELKPSPTSLDVLFLSKQIQPTLVTFDSLIRVHHSNENSSNEMASVMAQVKRIVDATGAACAIAHHFTKSGKNGSARIRGTGDVRAFCDLTFLLEPGRDHTLRVVHDKSRWTENIAPFAVKFKGDEEKFSIVCVGDKKQAMPLTVWEFVQAQLNGGAKSRTQLVEAAREMFSPHTIDRELQRGRQVGELAKVARGKDAYYSLAHPLSIVHPIAEGFVQPTDGLSFLPNLGKNNGREESRQQQAADG